MCMHYESTMGTTDYSLEYALVKIQWNNDGSPYRSCHVPRRELTYRWEHFQLETTY
jgi:hypothetical protein